MLWLVLCLKLLLILQIVIVYPLMSFVGFLIKGTAPHTSIIFVNLILLMRLHVLLIVLKDLHVRVYHAFVLLTAKSAFLDHGGRVVTDFLYQLDLLFPIQFPVVHVIA